MAVIKKNKKRTISTRKGTLVVRTKKEKKSAAEQIDDSLRKAADKFDKKYLK